MCPRGKLKRRGNLVAATLSHRGVKSFLHTSERNLAKQLHSIPQYPDDQDYEGDVARRLSWALEWLASSALFRHEDWPRWYCPDGFEGLQLRWLAPHVAEFDGRLYRFQWNVGLACVPMPIAGAVRVDPNGKHLRAYWLVIEDRGQPLIVSKKATELAHAAERAQREFDRLRLTPSRAPADA